MQGDGLYPALNYFSLGSWDIASCLSGQEWWDGTESNRRHEDFQSSALPTELPSQHDFVSTKKAEINIISITLSIEIEAINYYFCGTFLL